ncbi:MAG: UDP-N-acetylglucosamine 2-epimerase, partial [Planctomycetota bacterium]|nr:UDP-N-acetylglucosamine 2-epimerase [Planctomycetota bacterium]
MQRILTIIGTRPEVIKMAPLIRRLAAHPGCASFVCVSGQHRQMVDPLLQFFSIRVDFDLQAMSPGQTLNQLSGRIFQSIDAVLDAAQPDVVLVHGDTTTAMVAALAAFHRRIQVGHVEAGLRT